MHSLESRLADCFLAVFPTLDPAQVRTASLDTVAEWDSLAGLTLAAVVEEAFAIEIDGGDLVNLTSYSAVLEYLRAREVPERSVP
jgi:acyl carrier protein